MSDSDWHGYISQSGESRAQCEQGDYYYASAHSSEQNRKTFNFRRIRAISEKIIEKFGASVADRIASDIKRILEGNAK